MLQPAPSTQETPTDLWAMKKGISMASRCYSCHSNGESDLHLFFSCSLAQQVWLWLLSLQGTPPTTPLSISSVWATLVKGVDSHGRKTAVAIFFQVIYTLWFSRNEAKHRSKRPSLVKAQMICYDSFRGMFSSPLGTRIPSHPILRSLGWSEQLPPILSLSSWLPPSKLSIPSWLIVAELVFGRWASRRSCFELFFFVVATCWDWFRFGGLGWSVPLCFRESSCSLVFFRCILFPLCPGAFCPFFPLNTNLSISKNTR